MCGEGGEGGRGSKGRKREVCADLLADERVRVHLDIAAQHVLARPRQQRSVLAQGILSERVGADPRKKHERVS